MSYENLPVPISTAASLKNLNIVIYCFEQVKSNKKSTEFFSHSNSLQQRQENACNQLKASILINKRQRKKVLNWREITEGVQSVFKMALLNLYQLIFLGKSLKHEWERFQYEQSCRPSPCSVSSSTSLFSKIFNRVVDHLFEIKNKNSVIRRCAIWKQK